MRTKEWLLEELQSLKALLWRQEPRSDAWSFLDRCLRKTRQRYEAACRREPRPKGEVAYRLVSAAEDEKR